MLRRIRRMFAVIFLVMITLLFLDFTGTVHRWFGWMAKIQFLPSLLALNVGVIILLVAMTLLLGRVYYSIICPLGVMQDCFAWIGKKVKRNRYDYSKPLNIIRYTMLGLMILAIIFGIGLFVALFAPYSAYLKRKHNFINRSGTGICPIENLCKECQTAEECISLINQFVESKIK